MTPAKRTMPYRLIYRWKSGLNGKNAYWTEGKALEEARLILEAANARSSTIDLRVINVTTGETVYEPQTCQACRDAYATETAFILDEDGALLASIPCCRNCEDTIDLTFLDAHRDAQPEESTTPVKTTAAEPPAAESAVLEPAFSDERTTLYTGDATQVLATLPDASVDCIVTSPPYYQLRDYGHPDQYGLEDTPDAYIDILRATFGQARRVLSDAGTLWLNIGDTYNSYPANRGPGGKISARADDSRPAFPSGYGLIDKTLPNKSLLGIPWRVARALQEDGWILRNVVIWNKTNAIPATSKDRFGSRFEPIFLFVKKGRYRFTVPQSDAQQNGDVWSVPANSRGREHKAVMPLEIAQKAISAGCREGGTVLDMFSGSGTTVEAAVRLDRRGIGIDLNGTYNQNAWTSLQKIQPTLCPAGN